MRGVSDPNTHNVAARLVPLSFPSCT
jgi:hypothetical protein